MLLVTGGILSTIRFGVDMVFEVSQATTILHSVASNRHPALFCRDLSLRHLNKSAPPSVAIVHPTADGSFQELGRFGFNEAEIDDLHNLDLQGCLKNRDREPISFRECVCDECELVSSSQLKHLIAAIPAPSSGNSFGVLVIRGFSDLKPSLEDALIITALGFACEIYTSSIWSGTRINYSVKDEDSEEDFTERQRIVLRLLCEGRTNASIARQMNYSLATIKNDVTRIYRYLGAANRRDAILKAESLKLDLPQATPASF
jgi:DNA-binding CsgD family transcriptional regulator